MSAGPEHMTNVLVNWTHEPIDLEITPSTKLTGLVSEFP